MAREIAKAMFYKKDTNVQLSSLLNQHAFLSDLVEGLKDESRCKTILDDLNNLRDLLLPSITLHVAANFEKVKDLETPLRYLMEKIQGLNQPLVDRLQVTFDSQWINIDGNLDEEFSGTIVGIGCVESGFLFSSSPGINDFMDKDLSAILFYMQLLSQLEGPMWKKIRKNSYGYNVIPKPSEGIIVFSLYRATNLYEAFKDAKTIMEAQLEADSIFGTTLLESARSSLIFEIIEREKSVGDLVSQVLMNSFKGVPTDYNKFLVDQVATISIEDLRRVGAKYFRTMFKAGPSKVVIVCHPDKVESVKLQFEEFGHNLKQSSSLESSILSTCS